ncbi:MAG: hypothetical protein LLG04_13515 [Parachlamydia sp.]|nr:hypothetical protein [Parachlamydia sp.]
MAALIILLFCLGFSEAYAEEFPYDPPKNFTLSPRYIALHHPVTTDNPAAQLYFDQGLTMLYAFNQDAAYWSFLKASEADPNLAMAYWGMAFVLKKNADQDSQRNNKASQHLQQALDHQSRANGSERSYIAALAKMFISKPDDTYTEAMGNVHKQYPDDPDAAVLYAEVLMSLDPWHRSHDSEAPAGQEAIKLLESVLKNFPDHLGANHYYIHAVEASPHPEWALASADRMQKLLPASGHIVHMPSHIYIILGDYHRVVQANESAVAVDRAYIRHFGLRGTYPVNYLCHNLYFLTRAAVMEGNFGKSIQTAEELESTYLPQQATMPVEEYATVSLMVQLRFQRWKEILNRTEPNTKMHMVHALWLYARAMAYAHQGDVAKALEEQKRFQEEASPIPENYDFGFSPVGAILPFAKASLQAQILQAQGNTTAAIETLTQAVQEQDKWAADWYFPLRESLGGLLLGTAKYPEAEKVYREDLGRHPLSGRSLFGLMEALKAQGKSSDLFWVQLQFQKAWLYSDTDLEISQIQ